jgi:hypothetical protein
VSEIKCSESELDRVVRQLDEGDFDGLYCPGECACERGDLMPCGIGEEELYDCKPGYKHFDPRPGHKEFDDWAIFARKEEPSTDEWETINYG